MTDTPAASEGNGHRPAVPRAVPSEFADIMVWAAWLYFVDAMTQSDVAKTIGVSRVTVIKLLNEAKEKGLVNIEFNPVLAARVETSRRLAKAFDLNSAFVIPDNAERPLVERLGDAGAYLVQDGLQAGDVIGVAWGRTVLAAIRNLGLDQPIDDLTVVQVAASPNGLSADFSPELCVSLCANNLGARSVTLMAPALLSTPELKAMLLNEPSIRKQMAVIRSANKVLFGVGELTDGATVYTSELHSADALDQMVKTGAVGVVSGRFLDADGNEMPGPNHDRMLGLSIDELRGIPIRICVAGGLDKTRAILAALRGGLITDLVIDLATAEALMAQVEP
ncbi:MAG: sugar-binding transcriptional regulator [Devosiaceae bacterium]|nr:sugar-binding transcriptional regulator [Devosiaceae bacterium MH13]